MNAEILNFDELRKRRETNEGKSSGFASIEKILPNEQSRFKANVDLIKSFKGQPLSASSRDLYISNTKDWTPKEVKSFIADATQQQISMKWGFYSYLLSKLVHAQESIREHHEGRRSIARQLSVHNNKEEKE